MASEEFKPQRNVWESADSTFENALDEFEKRVGIVFKDRNLLKKAFTRETYAIATGTKEHNEHFEYKGDQMLARVLSQLYPDDEERQKLLARNNVLSRVAYDLGMNKCLRISRTEARKSKPEDQIKILADTVEAYLYALYVDRDDSGEESVRDFVLRHIVPLTNEMIPLHQKRTGAQKVIDLAIGDNPEKKSNNSRALERNPWILWGLQGDAHPYYPLNTDDENIAVPQDRWRTYFIDPEQKSGGYYRALKTAAAARGLRLEVNQGNINLAGERPIAIFIDGMIIASRYGHSLRQLSDTALKRLEMAHWNVAIAHAAYLERSSEISLRSDKPIEEK